MSGATSTAAGISLPPREAIQFLLGKVNTPTSGWSDVWQEAHTRAFMVAGAASRDLLADFRAAVAKALEQGTSLAEFRQDFNGIVERHGWQHTGTPGRRAQIIYETNLSMAYSAGRWAQLTEPDTLAAFPFWQYVHSGAAHPRLQHLAWNGLTLRADDPFWRTHYPPNGWKCGCRVRPLSSRDLRRQGKSAPDQAPAVTMVPWRRPSDGRMLQVPADIDPGFGYNVGEAWRDHRPAIPGDARMSPPPGWVPPLPLGVLPEPRRFSALREADLALRPAYQAWADQRSGAELDALRDYKGPLGRRLNAFLRNQRSWTGPVDIAFDTVKELDSAIEAARAPMDLRVFRGVSAREAQHLAHLGVGDEVMTRTYLSTSVVPELAAGLGDASLQVEILIPQGTRGAAYVHPFPAYQYPQAELLLRRRMGLRVVQREPGRIVFIVSNDKAALQPLE